MALSTAAPPETLVSDKRERLSMGAFQGFFAALDASVTSELVASSDMVVTCGWVLSVMMPFSLFTVRRSEAAK